MMNKLIYILLGALLVACQDELNVPASGGESDVAGRVLRFEVVVGRTALLARTSARCV